MAALATLVASYLLQDTTITAQTSTRVYDRDIRKAGAQVPTPAAYADNGTTLTHIIVDDGGGIASPFGPSGSYQDQMRIWIIAPNTATGRAQIETLTQRVRVRLHRWQESSTKAFLTFASRTGAVADPPSDTGVVDVLTFSVAGTAIGVSR